MKTTVELPDDLLREAKARAALQGLKLREMVEEGLRRVLSDAHPVPKKRALSAFETMKEFHGKFDSGIDNLGSDPKHLQDFGK